MVAACDERVSQFAKPIVAAVRAPGDRFASGDGGLPVLKFAGFFGGRRPIFIVAVFLEQPADEAWWVSRGGGDPAAKADVVAQQLVEVGGGPAVRGWFGEYGRPPSGGAFGGPVRRFVCLEPSVSQ